MEAFETDPHMPTTPPAEPAEPGEIGLFEATAAALIVAVDGRKNIEAQRKAELAPHDQIAKKWKPILDDAKAAEESLREVILMELGRLEVLQRRMLERAASSPELLARVLQIPELHGVSFAYRDDVEITDPLKIPRAYHMPDMTKIKAAVLAGVPVPGAVKVQRRGVVVR